MFIRKTIEEIERGSSSRFKEENEHEDKKSYNERQDCVRDNETPSTSKSYNWRNSKHDSFKEADEDGKDEKRKELDKGNGKKKSKSRARLEREQSKPSESDTEPEVDTVTVEIPRRRKRLRRPSERPRTPPTSLHSDSEGEVITFSH